MLKKISGTLFLIVGNSGSGKDSIISGVTQAFPPHLKQIYTPKRYITRPSSKTENNISITNDKFQELEKKGAFVLTWHIYNLNYGISIEIEDWLKKGHPVLINVSRTVIEKVRKTYENLKVILIYVPLESTIKRLKDRGRETLELIQERIERAKNNQLFPEADLIIDNSGNLDEAVIQCLDFIISIVKENQKL